MKKLFVLAMLFLSMQAFGNVVDIQFSPGGTAPGGWSYDGDLTLSFAQTIDIDIVQGQTTDALFNQSVYIPQLILSNAYTIVTPAGPVEIRDSGNNLLLQGTLGEGDFVSFFTVAASYCQYQADITITAVNNTIGSAYLNSVSVGAQFDFNLTLQSNENFADILGDGNQHGNGFSGSMDMVPEPTLIALIGLGGLMIRKRKI